MAGQGCQTLPTLSSYGLTIGSRKKWIPVSRTGMTLVADALAMSNLE